MSVSLSMHVDVQFDIVDILFGTDKWGNLDQFCILRLKRFPSNQRHKHIEVSNVDRMVDALFSRR